MIIKRLAEGIKKQDWFVVSVEIMIVVIGIFIGLQVDDWNNDRKAHLNLQKITLQMIRDCKTAISNIDSQVSINELRIKNGLLVLDILDGKELTPDLANSFENGSNDINKMSIPSIGVGALGSYLSGELLNIPFDEKLKHLLRNFENIAQSELDIISHLISRLDIENATLAQFFAMTIEVVPELKKRYDLKNMRDSNEYIYAFQSSIGLQAAYIERVSIIKEQLIKLLKGLENSQ